MGSRRNRRQSDRSSLLCKSLLNNYRKKGENQLAIGNVIGSNIFNILFVVGASGAIRELVIEPSLMVDIVFMAFVTILFYVFGKTQLKYDKKEGIVFITLFVIYMAFAILRN